MKIKPRNKKYYIGVDIGGTKIAAGLVDSDGIVIETGKVATLQKATGSQIFDQVKKLISELLENQNFSIGKIHGIGVGVPGIVKPNHRDILITPNVKLTGYPLAGNLEKAFMAKVVLGNDVNVGLLGEKWQGVGRDAGNIIGLFPGTGVGGGIIIDGRLVCGSQGAAGELGHVIMDLNSKKQSAGVKGSLEALASRRAIERDMRDRIKKGEKTFISRFLKTKTAMIKSGLIAKALNKKDPLTMEVINDVCRVLGQACVSMRHIFNPDMIILGGGVIEACGGYMLPRIRKISNSDLFFKGIDHCTIEQSLLGDHAIILGAVALLIQVTGKKSFAEGDSYPNVGMDKDANILIDDKLIKKNMYIRADGKAKKINGSVAFTELKNKHVLALSGLKKICKKNPNILIIGSCGKSLTISNDGKRFLKEKHIEARQFNTENAIKAYNGTNGRKAIVLCHKSLTE